MTDENKTIRTYTVGEVYEVHHPEVCGIDYEVKILELTDDLCFVWGTVLRSTDQNRRLGERELWNVANFSRLLRSEKT